jgi:outer membrane immunogenic protein
MRIWLLAIVAAATWSSWAAAEDWSGFYAGARVGYGTTDFDAEDKFREMFGSEFLISDGPVISMGELWQLITDDCFCNERIEDTDGATGGFHLGYNWQTGSRFVFGIEAASVKSSFSDMAGLDGLYDDFLDETPVDFADVGGFVDFRLGSIFSAVGRAGVAFDRLLVTGSAGVAFAKAKMLTIGGAALLMDDSSEGFSVFAFQGDEWVAGLVLGAGLEFALTEYVSLRLDYQHIAFDGFDLEGLQAEGSQFNMVPASREVGFDVEMVTAGVNFRF